MFLVRVGIALVIMAGALVWAAQGAEHWFSAAAWARISRLAWVVAAGTVAYFASLWLVGFRPSHFSKRVA